MNSLKKFRKLTGAEIKALTANNCIVTTGIMFRSRKALILHDARM